MNAQAGFYIIGLLLGCGLLSAAASYLVYDDLRIRRLRATLDVLASEICRRYIGTIPVEEVPDFRSLLQSIALLKRHAGDLSLQVMERFQTRNDTPALGAASSVSTSRSMAALILLWQAVNLYILMETAAGRHRLWSEQLLQVPNVRGGVEAEQIVPLFGGLRLASASTW